MKKRIFFSPITLSDLGGPQGADNFGGVASTVYFCPWDDIATFPALPTSPTTVDDLVELATGDITCKTGKKFVKVYTTSETGKLDCKLVGPRDAKGWTNMFDASTPGSAPQALGTFAYLANRPGVYFVTELDGQIRMIGDKLSPAYLEEVDASTGGKVEDGKFSKWTIKSTGRMAPIYAGAIPLTAAA